MRFELDRYNGVVIDPTSLPADINNLIIDLEELITYLIRQRKSLAWISVPIASAASIPLFINAGFTFHSCLRDELTLVRQPEYPTFVPFVPTHTIGAGAIVLSDTNEILVVKERGSKGFKLPGGHVEATERIQDSIQREVLEETGIDAKFESIVGFTSKHPYQFGKSNLHFICQMRALTHAINILDVDEIEDAKWISLNAYISDPTNSLSNREMISRVAFSSGLMATDVSGNNGPHRKHEIFMAVPAVVAHL
ncbi:DNA mismatch repair protein MutT [Pseudomonas sp. 31-12]|uniref:NUDIX hydrolase n=1 Tax=Pseudomonas sp. 31-12 TaxID=2201356 RepID=UPI000D6C8D44|nr:NUDIX domain-containing protein [Pseudomonas sp. 31-12]AWM91596.1 DNA mismatch repair protein MutT [Pseudomonas sp. 31-12]